MDYDKYGGRRFLMSMLVGLTTALLTYLGKIDGATYSLTILGTVGAYIAGNVIQKVKAPDATTTNT